ncbi:MAG: DNA-3-methyladenine glycosylase [Salinivirgaceae bacterium]|nr:DNA-3-methyladenine glycosylase [Salinivirgaceae bacterium]
MKTKLQQDFFTRDVLDVAPDLVGKTIVRKFANGQVKRVVISEVEAYRGEDDLACHASKGRTTRTDIMYHEGGHIYVYLIYGMHYMLNFVTSIENNPQAVLIRGVDNVLGPGRVAKLLEIDKSFHRSSLFTSDSIWLEDNVDVSSYRTDVRVGIDYAGDYWKNRPWRFIKI